MLSVLKLKADMDGMDLVDSWMSPLFSWQTSMSKGNMGAQEKLQYFSLVRMLREVGGFQKLIQPNYPQQGTHNGLMDQEANSNF